MSTSIYDLDRIKSVLPQIDVVKEIEDGFVAYSRKQVVVPPVGELVFDEPPGDVHIKYGYISGGDHFVIKIASGFYDNPQKGLPSGNGLMLIFDQKTGELECLLLDGGYLTDIRTAAAGAVAAKYLAPNSVEAIGILGAGTQGRLQLEYLDSVISCRKVWVWGINSAELDSYKKDMSAKGFDIHTTQEAGEVAANCNLIVTATPSKSPLLHSHQIRPGTHITAVGSDTTDKIELDPEILGRADIIIADSLSQCRVRGEIHHALKAGVIDMVRVRELGEAVGDERLRRSAESQISVADLTGVAIQDIQIAKAVFKALKS